MVDKSYWASLDAPPLAPSDNDVAVFKSNLLQGNTLLLGCTKKLLELSDVQMDIDPWYTADTVVVQDWTTNKTNYTNIIGDGVLNLTEDLTNGIITMVKDHCNIFIARCFNYKLPTMRVATYFPSEYDFTIAPTESIKFTEYSFYTWRF